MKRVYLFSAFEPSGDILAATLIRALKAKTPDAQVFALAGPHCQEAGATLLETTTEHAAMGLDVLSEVKRHKARLKRLERWLSQHEIDALVPVDSPAANWSVCQLVRKSQPKAKIVHLVAPQVWAWGTWRVNKLRRLTDHVMGLMPFEPDWFGQRRVPCTFVGHPLFDLTPEASVEGLPDSPSADQSRVPKIALLPGSRPKEISRNAPLMLDALDLLAQKHEGLQAVFGLRTDADRVLLEQADGRSRQHTVVADRTDDVIQWADVVLAVSGTVTLQVACRGTPLVACFRVNQLPWQIFGRWVIATRTFTLPNIIHEWLKAGRLIDEHIPNFGEPGPLADSMQALLTDGAKAQAIQAGYQKIRDAFEAVSFERKAVETLLAVVEGERN